MLDTLLAQCAGLRCFIVCETRPHPTKPGKVDKVPVDANGYEVDSQDPRNWLMPEQALARAQAEYRYVGIVLHEALGIGCVDVDHCAVRDAEGNVTGWNARAHEICSRFPGAGTEISQSGESLHVFFRHAPIPKHRTRKKTVPGLEVYTRARFIMLTGTAYIGDLRTDHTAGLQRLIADYFPEPPAPEGGEWTDGPYEGWRGGGTDEQIIFGMINRRTAASAFGSAVSFADLWNANADALSQYFPPDSNSKSGLSWNGSSADQALANHLAYATGYDCERTLALMFKSALRRDKWERMDNYLVPTILRAVAGKREEAEERARAGRVLIERAGETFAYDPPPPPPMVTVGEFVVPAPPPADSSAPSWAPPPPPPVMTGPEPIRVFDRNPPAGKFITVSEFPQLFAGHMYVQDVNGIILDNGELVDQKQFNARHGGRVFQMTVDGQSTKHAWEAYIENQVERMPRADTMTFDPRVASGITVERDGLVCFNSYVPIKVPMAEGDVSPYLEHIGKLFPYGSDKEIALCYFAALVQFKGYKFKWAPLFQGVPGNGKTFLSHVMEHCLGARYTHHARASTLGSNFNAAFYGKLLVCIEDVHISENKSSVWEALKPMITAERMEIEGKGLNQVNRDVCFNFILDSNHKGALRKTEDDRRIAPFFAAQQRVTDLIRCGMDRHYFIRLWDWANKQNGFAHVHHYLAHYKIPDALNPATDCIRAPETTSTQAAIIASRGSVEQEVIEAIDSGAEGFRDGWVSSIAFDRLLSQMGRSRMIPREQRKQLLFDLGYELHPNLPAGRVIMTLPDGTRPLLYLRPSHAAYGLAPSEATAAFLTAQGPRK